MNCSEAKPFNENYLTSDFYTNSVISRVLPTREDYIGNRGKVYRVCLI